MEEEEKDGMILTYYFLQDQSKQPNGGATGGPKAFEPFCVRVLLHWREEKEHQK